MINLAKDSMKYFPVKNEEFNIDPISTLAIMALHPLREQGTKYQFHKKGVSPQETKNYKYGGINTRGVCRTVQGYWNGGGTNCEDINHIWVAYLKILVIWEPQKNDNDPVFQLIKSASKGLRLIKENTYSNKPEVLIEGFNSWGQKMVNLSMDKDDKTNIKIIESLEDIELCEKIKNIWTEKEIINLNQQIDNAFDEENKNPEVYIKLVATLTEDKFKQYRKLIK